MTTGHRTGVDFTSGEEVGFADLEELDKCGYGLAFKTANEGPFGATETDISDLHIDDVEIPGSRWIEVVCSVMVEGSVAGNHCNIRIYIGGTMIRRGQFEMSQIVGIEKECMVRGIINPGAGTYSFKATIERTSAAGGTVQVDCGFTYPGILSVGDWAPGFAVS